MSTRRKFSRATGPGNYRKTFVIAFEGAKTEPQYFAILKKLQSVAHVKCLKGRRTKSSPDKVLARMQKCLKKLKGTYEAWLVVDKDQWMADQLGKLSSWAKTDSRYGLALSNPKFEYWLLLHFEDGNNIASSAACSKRLKRYLTDYDKGISVNCITRKHVDKAIRCARQRDNPPCVDWPRTLGGTTVYKLVENILKHDKTATVPVG